MIKYQGISTLEVLEEAKNYNNWIAHEIKKHVIYPALEVGAGTGNLSKYFLSNAILYISDADKDLVQHLKKRFKENKKVYFKELDITKRPSKTLISYFSSIYAINVLEHIKDDEKALRNMHSLLKDNGNLLLLVPAKKAAYTKLDKELGHYRRYEKNELIEKLKNTGFKIEKIYFFNIVGLISWTIRDKVKRKKSIHLKPYHIRIFDSIVPFLRFLESFIKVPVGISLIVIAKKMK